MSRPRVLIAKHHATDHRQSTPCKDTLHLRQLRVDRMGTGDCVTTRSIMSLIASLVGASGTKFARLPNSGRRRDSRNIAADLRRVFWLRNRQLLR